MSTKRRSLVLRRVIVLGVSLVAVPCAALLMTACAPMTTSFYRPTAPEGKVVRAHCPPVDAFILIERQGVIVGARADYSSTDRLAVTITFEVPEGRVVRLLDRAVEVSVPSRGTSKGELVGSVWTSPWRTSNIAVDTPLIGKTTERFSKQTTLYGWTPHAYYFFDASLTVPTAEAFTLKLPRFLVNNGEVELPLIKFSREKRSYVGSMNC